MPSEIEKLRKMKVGEVAFVNGLLPGLGSTPVEVTKTAYRKNLCMAGYELRYLGVPIGEVFIQVSLSGETTVGVL